MTDSNSLFNSRQIKYLKGLAHPLHPVVQIGKDGITTAIIDTVQAELKRHELIKVKINNNSNVNKKTASKELEELSTSTLVQLIGKTIVLYKENKKLPKDKRISIPKN